MSPKVCKMLHDVGSPKEVKMDTMEKPTSVKECSRLTGIPYQWLVNEVKRGLNPPPRYQRPGRKGYQVIPKEVMEWYREVSEVK